MCTFREQLPACVLLPSCFIFQHEIFLCKVHKQECLQTELI